EVHPYRVLVARSRSLSVRALPLRLALSPTLRVLCFITARAPPEIHALSLHDALPISAPQDRRTAGRPLRPTVGTPAGRVCAKDRSEDHTSELQSRFDLVCRLLLEKKNEKNQIL